MMSMMGKEAEREPNKNEIKLQYIWIRHRGCSFSCFNYFVAAHLFAQIHEAKVELTTTSKKEQNAIRVIIYPHSLFPSLSPPSKSPATGIT